VRPLIIVPTFDDRDNLPRLAAVLLQLPDVRLMIVDDGSPDGTGAVADQIAAGAAGRVAVVHRSGRRGLGRSYIEGMRHALDGDATHICQMDADFSHDPADVPRLLAAGRDADLVIGSRYVPGGAVRNWPAHRRALSACGNWYVRAITRLPVHDATSGFRCWRRELLGRLPLERVRSNGYAFQIEMTWAAARAGGRITEVPITFVERRSGTSKMSGGVITEAIRLPWRLIAGGRRPR
jgi:dolichol-phosphate mannosyltransferase